MGSLHLLFGFLYVLLTLEYQENKTIEEEERENTSEKTPLKVSEQVLEETLDKNSNSKHSENQKDSVASILLNPVMLLCLLPFMTCVGGHGLVNVILAPLLKTYLQFDEMRISILFLLLGLAEVVFMLLMGYLVDSGYSKILHLLAPLSGTIAYLLFAAFVKLPSFQNIFVVICSLFLIGFCLASGFLSTVKLGCNVYQERKRPSLGPEVMDDVKDKALVVVSIKVMWLLGRALFCSLIGGVVFHHWGFLAAFLATACVLLCGAISFCIHVCHFCV